VAAVENLSQREQQAAQAIAAEWERMKREGREPASSQLAAVMPRDWTVRLGRAALAVGGTEDSVDAAAIWAVITTLRAMSHRPFGPGSFLILAELAEQLEEALPSSPSEGGVGP
jgi:hypothetical protein